MMPGSAASLAHSGPRRFAYALVALLLALTGGLGNALVSANLPQIQGHLGLTPVQGQWLVAAYLMTNVSANILLFKFRQQFGLRLFAQLGMPLYVVATLLHLFAQSFETAMAARLVSGFATSVCSSLGIFYLMQAAGKRWLLQALVIGVGLSQLTIPIAWLMSPALLDLGEWRTLYLMESGLAMLCFAAVSVLHLPAGQQVRVFEWHDLITYILLGPALALLTAVLAQGRTQWWTAQSWIGWSLIGALLLGTAGFAFEHYRRNPMLQVAWIGTASTIRLVIGAIAIRFLLSEQTFGAVGLLRQLGMGPDQLQPLYAFMLLGLIVGIGVSAATFSDKMAIPQILFAMIAVGIAALIDRDATSLTRPHDMFLSQTLVSVGAGMFLGPLLLTTIMGALKRGPDYIISASILFAMSQSLGGLLGPAMLGTFQQFREHEYSAQITAAIDPTDPIVADRLRLQSGALTGLVSDPVIARAQGIGQLAQSATLEANVRAYNDVFTLTGLLAVAVLLWSLFHVVRLARTRSPSREG